MKNVEYLYYNHMVPNTRLRWSEGFALEIQDLEEYGWTTTERPSYIPASLEEVEDLVDRFWENHTPNPVEGGHLPGAKKNT